MSTITTTDGTQIYYKDWGSGTTARVFSHGWPLSADAFEDQMFFLASQGYRCIAHDRRGHGRSSQPWNGNDMDTYADDLAALVAALDLKDAIHVGHSTGGGEVARYIGRHGTTRVAKAVLISAIPPLMLKTAANPGGTPMEAFDQIRAAVLADRSQFFKDLACRSTAPTGQAPGSRKACATHSGCKGCRPASRASSTASRPSPSRTTPKISRQFDVPTLHHPRRRRPDRAIGASALRSSTLVKHATLKVYPGAPHGLASTHKEQVNADLLAFLKA